MCQNSPPPTKEEVAKSEKFYFDLNGLKYPSSMILFNNTSEYCLLGKLGMAEQSNSCPWPLIPTSSGGPCGSTWLDYVGRDTAFASNILFTAYFGAGWIISGRMQVWVLTRLRSKGLKQSARTGNEWLSLYIFILCTLRLTMEMGYGNEGFLSFKSQFVLQKVIGGFMLIIPYTLTWSWYKILLQPSEKRRKGARANKLHLISVASTILCETFSGVLGVVLLPEEYKDAGVYVGNFHAAARIILGLNLAATGYVCIRMGRNIQSKLRSGGAKGPAEGNKGKVNKKEMKKAAKKGKEEAKIGLLVSRVFIVIKVALLYMVYDIYSSLFKLRHVTAPLCKASSVFVRPPTWIHVMVVFAALRYFGVKDPNAKSKVRGGGGRRGRERGGGRATEREANQ